MVPRCRDRHDDAVSAFGRPDQLDAVCLEPTRGELSGWIAPALADEPSLRAERGRPGGDVRRLSACADVRDRRPVVAGHERTLDLHDDVEDQIAEGRQEHA